MAPIENNNEDFCEHGTFICWSITCNDCIRDEAKKEVEKELVKAWDIIRFIKDFNSLDVKSRSKATWFLKRHKKLVQKARNDQESSDGRNEQTRTNNEQGEQR